MNELLGNSPTTLYLLSPFRAAVCEMLLVQRQLSVHLSFPARVLQPDPS